MEVQTDQKPTSEDVKEVYARFGLAYYHAEVLHRGLCIFYCFSQIPPVGPITNPRVEEHFRTAFETTLGQLLLKLQPILPTAILPKLERALERRNFLAHRFWFESVHLLLSATGVEALINELSEDTSSFSELDEQIEELIEPLGVRLGITSESVALSLAEVLGGREWEPLNAQRKPKKKERIIAIFNSPTPSGHNSLVFQADDGTLWQLCDAGLGWTTCDKADPAWTTAQKFVDILPADVTSRPSASAPWNFDMSFGIEATLEIRPGKLPGEVTYKLSRRT